MTSIHSRKQTRNFRVSFAALIPKTCDRTPILMKWTLIQRYDLLHTRTQIYSLALSVDGAKLEVTEAPPAKIGLSDMNWG